MSPLTHELATDADLDRPAMPRATRIGQRPAHGVTPSERAASMFDGPDALRFGGIEMAGTRVRLEAGRGQGRLGAELGLVDRQVLRTLMLAALRKADELARLGRGQGHIDLDRTDLVTHDAMQRACQMNSASGWTRILGIVIARLRKQLDGIGARVVIESVTEGARGEWGYRLRGGAR